jgi:glycosyltransferase involved in cell wall biosynthesis
VNVSIIIPVLEDPRLRTCLEALRSQQPPLQDDVEILVVDNGPSEHIRQIAEEFSARYLVESRRGCDPARNCGLAAAKGALVVFTDADCVPPPHWLQTIRDLFRDETLRIAIGPSDSFNRSKVELWVQSLDDARWSALSREHEIWYSDGRNLAARREVFDLDRFDEQLNDCGDIELGWRVARRGERIRLAPEMWLWHQNPTSVWKVLLRSARRGRGVQKVRQKHGPQARITAERPVRVLGRDLKPVIVRLACSRPLRWPSAFVLCGLLGILLGTLLALQRLPVPERYGRTPFRWMDRASILLGRVLV